MNIFLLVILSNFVYVMSNKCGLRLNQEVSNKRKHENVFGIVGGTEVTPGDFGWQIRLTYNGYVDFGYPWYFTCGGSLISDQWVVSAAHCVTRCNDITGQCKIDNKIENYRIDVGINQQIDGIFGSDNEWSQPGLAVSKLITHPNFVETLYPNSSIYAGYLSNLLNDVVLFKLAEPVKLFTENNQVIPICLPDKEDLDSINFENSTGIITGWGQTNDPGNVSMNLLEVEIPLLSNQVCQDLAGNFFNPLTQTCAGGFNISKSACYGDSGGPLAVQNEDGRWFLYGLTSYGIGCGIYPNYYTRVSFFTEWIKETIKTDKPPEKIHHIKKKIY